MIQQTIPWEKRICNTERVCQALRIPWSENQVSFNNSLWLVRNCCQKLLDEANFFRIRSFGQ